MEGFNILGTVSLQLLYTYLAANIFKPHVFDVITVGHIQPFSVVFGQSCIINFLFHPYFSKVMDRE